VLGWRNGGGGGEIKKPEDQRGTMKLGTGYGIKNNMRGARGSFSIGGIGIP